MTSLETIDLNVVKEIYIHAPNIFVSTVSALVLGDSVGAIAVGERVRNVKNNIAVSLLGLGSAALLSFTIPEFINSGISTGIPNTEVISQALEPWYTWGILGGATVGGLMGGFRHSK